MPTVACKTIILIPLCSALYAAQTGRMWKTRDVLEWLHNFGHLLSKKKLRDDFEVLRRQSQLWWDYNHKKMFGTGEVQKRSHWSFRLTYRFGFLAKIITVVQNLVKVWSTPLFAAVFHISSLDAAGAFWRRFPYGMQKLAAGTTVRSLNSNSLYCEKVLQGRGSFAHIKLRSRTDRAISAECRAKLLRHYRNRNRVGTGC